MAAFRHAIAAGVPVLELDVVLSADGHLVVHHDLAINPALCRGPVSGWLSQLSLTALWSLDCGTASFPGLRLPVFEQVLELVQGTPVKLMVETKMAADADAHFVPPARVVDKIDQALRRYALSRQVWLQSFDHRTLAEMRRRNPQVRLVMLNPRTRLADYVAPARALGNATQFLNFRLVRAADVQRLHAAGIEVFSGTTDDPAEWARLKAIGVDAILTDDPLGLARFLRDAR